MIVQTEKLDISTSYGKLTVPVKDLLAVEFGVHCPEGVEAKIEGAVEQLGSADFRERDKATKMLLDSGPLAYPAVIAARQSTDLEVAKRAKDIVKQLQANHDKKDLRFNTEDKIVTPKFTIVGTILTPSIKATTELFADVELSVAKMQTFRALERRGRTQEVEITVDAAKYANAGQWMETDFESNGETKVLITAKGAVDTWPQQPGQWMVGPGGQGQQGQLMCAVAALAALARALPRARSCRRSTVAFSLAGSAKTANPSSLVPGLRER
jgi:hypothetical protein